jgi:hypothetical protein
MTNTFRVALLISLFGLAACAEQGSNYRQMVDTKAPDMAYSTAPLSGVEHSTDAGAQNPEGTGPVP